MSIDPHQLAALASIVRCGSFEAAAAQLNVTPSAISQRIKTLEESVGTTLIYRGQPCLPTPAGVKLARHADDVALLESHVRRDIAPTSQLTSPRVRIAVNADSLATWLVPALAQVPDMLFELVIDDQDTSPDWLLRGAVSAAITGEAHAVSGCNCQELGALRYIATASPDFMARWFDAGVNAATLTKAPILTFNSKDRLQHRWITQITQEKLTPPAHQLPSTHAFIDAAFAGLGWGLNPLPLVEGYLTQGALVPVVPNEPMDVDLYWQTSRLMSAALAPLTHGIKAAGLKHLVQNSHTTVMQ